MRQNPPEKRAAIMRAALELIAENGFHGAPIDRIARNARVGQGSIYRYFENKDGLIYELYQELEIEIGALIMSNVSDKVPVRQWFMGIHQTLLRFFIDHPIKFKFLGQFYNAPYGIALRKEWAPSHDKSTLGEVFETGKSLQIIKRLPLEILWALAFGPVEFIARSHNAGHIYLDDQMIRELNDACWDSLKR